MSNTFTESPVGGGGGGTVTVTLPAPTAIFTGGQAVTASAVALASQALAQGIVLLNLGPAVIYFGPTGVTTATGFPIQPQQAASIAENNSNLVFVIAAATGSSVSWFGS